MKKLQIILILFLTSVTCIGQWNNIYIDSIYYELRDLHFFNKDTGVACGYIAHAEGAIIRTYDGGINWQNTISDILFCTAIDFVNDLVGYSGGQDGAVYKTIDGGINWEYISGIEPYTADYEDMEFLNDSVGFIKKYYGSLYKTIDGAQTWYQVTPYINSDFYAGKNHSIHFIDDSIGFVVGKSAIFKTIDQGENWVQQEADSGYYYRAIYMIDYDEGFAVGNDGVLAHTIDGGETWTNDSIGFRDLLNIVFISDSVGFIVGNDQYPFIHSDSIGAVLRTNDRGRTWEESEICNHTINAITYVDSVSYIVGKYGSVYKNDNFSNLTNNNTIDYPSNDFKVWPNPATNEIFISAYDKKYNEIIILDISGNEIFRSAFYSSKKFDISGIIPGLYFIITSCDNHVYVNKLIIQ